MNQRPARKRGLASSMLMAAMLAVIDLLGYERPRDQTVETADTPKGDDHLPLRWRHLDSLN